MYDHNSFYQFPDFLHDFWEGPRPPFSLFFCTRLGPRSELSGTSAHLTRALRLKATSKKLGITGGPLEPQTITKFGIDLT